MTFRITADNLDELPPAMRAQVEKAMNAHAPNCAPERRIPAKQANRPEEDAGRALTTWMDSLVMPNGLRPGEFFFHVPNGLARTAAKGGIFKAQGLRKGWPDYCLDLPLGRYHGARLELKSINGSKPTTEQLDILARLESVGFKCFVAWGYDQAREQLSGYLDIAN